jgi:hypothetical protein
MPRFLAHMQLHGSSSSAAQPSSHGSIAETKLSGRVESPSAAPAPAPVARPGQIRLDGGPEPATHGLVVVFVVRHSMVSSILNNCLSRVFLTFFWSVLNDVQCRQARVAVRARSASSLAAWTSPRATSPILKRTCNQVGLATVPLFSSVYIP